MSPPPSAESLITAKRAVGKAAAALVEQGMLVGLGSGSTATCFCEALAERHRTGLQVTCLSSSHVIAHYAQQLGLPLKDPAHIASIDLVVDGADEIDLSHQMIKGGGGALLREKLLAQCSREVVIIVDETKLVKQLGRCPVPVEIIPFLYLTTLKRLNRAGYHGNLRLTENGTPYLTDHGNYIVDLSSHAPLSRPDLEHARLKQITGVVETGLFFHIAGRVLVGHRDGSVVMRN